MQALKNLKAWSTAACALSFVIVTNAPGCGGGGSNNGSSGGDSGVSEGSSGGPSSGSGSGGSSSGSGGSSGGPSSGSGSGGGSSGSGGSSGGGGSSSSGGDASAGEGGGGGPGGGPGSPTVFFTDLTSGPNSGGESSGAFSGAYATLYGERFGTSQGTSTITLNGSNCMRVISWGTPWLWYQKIVVQLGSACSSGNLVVTTGAGSSNGAPFTVRPGNIYCVSTTGSDTGSGAFPNCFATLMKARDSMSAGDITYATNGVTQSADDGQGWNSCLSISTSGQQDSPMALVAYPGATVTLGSSTSTITGLKVVPPGNTGTTSHWVFAGLVLRSGLDSAYGNDVSISPSSVDFRIVGNDMTCASENGETGCVAVSRISDVKSYGNHVHDVDGALGGPSNKQQHSIYFSTDSNHIEMAWNSVHDNNSLYGVQFHSSPLCIPSCGSADTTGYSLYDIIVHDNLFYNQTGSAINFATVDPSKGPVEAYNNLMYNVGYQPATDGGSQAGVYSPGYHNNGPDGSGTVKVFNNTMYECGDGAVEVFDGTEGGAPSTDTLSFTNNIVQQATGQVYLSAYTTLSLLSGSNNVWYGAGAGPSQMTANVDADPLFVSSLTDDFHLSAGSPAIGAGVDTGIAADLDGNSRGTAFDIGAYQRVP